MDKIMAETTFAVQGMTCGHCATSVQEEVGELRGVRKVDVDVASGLVVVASEEELDLDQVANAVRVAGYEFVQ
jgi:copper ion binding protein